ncbi:MAG: hypothetical protein HQM15_09965 [Deltaproteobacteria bacterium]|nr:hypothetical protein [Deltaproteobacteria bacterium]
MLKLFFNRKSWIVKLLFFCSAGLSLYFFIKTDWRAWSLIRKSGLFLFFFQVFFAFGVEKYPWYPQDSLGPGIGLQFQKALVPIAYIWPLFLIGLYEFSSPPLFYIFNLLLLPITLTSSVLIFFHFTDDDSSPPNLLSGKKH